MKKILLITLVLILLVSVTPAFAQARYGGRQAAVESNTALALPAGTWVYGISVYASSSNAQFGIYDIATLGEATVANMGNGDEVGEATQYETAQKPFVKPRYFTNGVTAIISNGVGFIEYGSEPS